MLSTQYRLRLEFICNKIANKEEVKLEDMIWAEKIAKSYTTARDWLNKARRQASQDIQDGSMDDFKRFAPWTHPSRNLPHPQQREKMADRLL